MNALLTVKIPLELAKQLDESLDNVKKLHEKDLKTHEKNAKSALLQSATTGEGSRAAVAQLTRVRLIERGKRITTANLVRMVIELGLRQIVNPATALEWMETSGSARGRPRGT